MTSPHNGVSCATLNKLCSAVYPSIVSCQYSASNINYLWTSWNRQRRLDSHRFGRYIKKSLYANMLGPRGVQITKMFRTIQFVYKAEHTEYFIFSAQQNTYEYYYFRRLEDSDNWSSDKCTLCGSEMLWMTTVSAQDYEWCFPFDFPRLHAVTLCTI